MGWGEGKGVADTWDGGGGHLGWGTLSQTVVLKKL